MSSTRTSTNGEFNQEKFCSSQEFEQGLRANLVAKRCTLIKDTKEREFIFWLQDESWKPGGLKVLVERLMEFAPDQVGTPTLRNKSANTIPMSELLDDDEIVAMAMRELCGDYKQPAPKGRIEGLEYCREKLVKTVPDVLANYCLNPKAQALDIHWFSNLKESLLQLKAQPIQNDQFIPTAISKLIFTELNFAKKGGLFLVQGRERCGKSTAAMQWCAENSGIARFVKVPAAGGDAPFYRAIARALGMASSHSMKGQQMCERIEDVIRSSKLMLVFDSAEYCWPMSNRREALPNRLIWIMSALVEHGAPVVLIARPQFTQDQKTIERKTLWRSANFLSMLTHFLPLPAKVSREDMIAIASHHLPDATEASIKSIASYAGASAKHVAGIESVVRTAREIASRDGRQSVSAEDVFRAIKDEVLPSDNALSEVLENESKPQSRRIRPGRQTRESFVPLPELDSEEDFQERNSTVRKEEALGSERLTSTALMTD
jgi:hypothetical protein